MPVLKALKRGDALPVTKLEVANRSQFANGESFGETGPYELVEGTVHFAVDPLHPRNQMIADLDLAPRDSAGKVSMSADFSVLKPAAVRRSEPGRENRPYRVQQPAGLARPNGAFGIGKRILDAPRLHRRLGRLAS